MVPQKIYTYALGILLILVSCRKKEVVKPSPDVYPLMQYFDLKDSVVQAGKYCLLDLDNDKEYDVVFSTLLVGDPIQKVDKSQWLAGTSLKASLLIGSAEELPVFRLLDSIPIANLPAHTWYNAAASVIAQKIMPLSGDDYWEGEWKSANHQFIGIQLLRNQHKINGWIEISFNQATEKLILHRAAICQTPDVTVYAGK
ncbi:hypothetical protein DVR12_18360 [Chitinophaga silvatica]|uniref:Uncharacterized protein n=1 Tax=Chitinophaga silvatica TaxID=2282649 RepID=A0A3E1Y6H0_9BACT|nr:hypothetical protein [Chitinophaga silvatica]RFS20530.1 hypothetical protein DVR12_18360 [Chitinophaga silvatica]